jgi:hypothetical protein
MGQTEADAMSFAVRVRANLARVREFAALGHATALLFIIGALLSSNRRRSWSRRRRKQRLSTSRAWVPKRRGPTTLARLGQCFAQWLLWRQTLWLPHDHALLDLEVSRNERSRVEPHRRSDRARDRRAHVLADYAVPATC